MTKKLTGLFSASSRDEAHQKEQIEAMTKALNESNRDELIGFAVGSDEFEFNINGAKVKGSYSPRMSDFGIAIIGTKGEQRISLSTTATYKEFDAAVKTVRETLKRIASL